MEITTLTEPTNDLAMPAGLPDGARRASSSPELLLSRLDQPGIAACRSRMATMLRLMQAMTFDSMRSVRKTVTPGQAASSRLDRPMLIGTSELLPATIGGMTAKVEICVVPKKNWLAMRITVSCPPMLGSTVVIETIREDRSNLFSPTDGKEPAIAALRRLLTLVVAAETHVAKSMQEGENPEPTDPARIAAAEHERRMASLLTRAADEDDDAPSPPPVEFEFGNPYPLSPPDVRDDPFPVSDVAMEWLASQAPAIVELREGREGISTVYEFGPYEGSARMERDLDPMTTLRVHAASSGAPDGILSDTWAEGFR